MYALDFEYGGKFLSDFGFIICEFDKSLGGFDTASAGSNLTFNTVQIDNGKYFSLQSVKYDECISATFGICKNPEVFDDMEVTNDEYRDLIRWLNRRDFHKFQVIMEDEEIRDACYFNASFNVEKVKIADVLYGLNLSMVTDRPYGYGKEITNTLSITDTTKEYILSDVSDEIGFVYPDVKIKVFSSGDLKIHNSFMDSQTIINNCTNGEEITLHGKEQLIETNKPTHKVMNDFNFEFIKLGNDYRDRFNVFTSTLPCEITITYSPIIKDIPN